jgi:hypothetical protein
MLPAMKVLAQGRRLRGTGARRVFGRTPNAAWSANCRSYRARIAPVAAWIRSAEDRHGDRGAAAVMRGFGT